MPKRSDRGTFAKRSRRGVLQATGIALIGLGGLTSLSTPAAANTDQEWAFKTNDEVRSSSTVVDGTVYSGSQDGNVYAVDANSGNLEWTVETGAQVSVAPNVVDGMVYAGSRDDQLYAIEAATGDVEWTFATENNIQSAPTVTDGTVYVGSNDTHVYAVDADTGEQQWRFATGDRISSAPTVIDGVVYIGSRDGTLYALGADSGDVVAAFEADERITSSPTIADGAVFIGETNGPLYAIDVETGDQRWAFEGGGGGWGSPTVFEGTLFVTLGSSLFAIRTSDGRRLWEYDADATDRVRGAPTVVGDTVFVSSGQGVIAVDALTGTRRWGFETDGRVRSSPTVVDGTAYIGSDDGAVYAIETDVTGSSADSRVRLGTLGHHHTWARHTTVTTVPIADWNDLAGIDPTSGDRYVLTNDLDAETAGYETVASPDANGGEGFAPIGAATAPFNGHFDGAGYEIRDLVIDRFGSAEVGLFGVIGDEGVIEDLSLAGEITADITTGLLAGRNRGRIDGVVAEASIDPQAEQFQIGGLVGANNGDITRSAAAADITANDVGIAVGGLVGENAADATVRRSGATGHLGVGGSGGGLAGENNGRISRAFAATTLESPADAPTLGGLVGIHGPDAAIIAAYATGSVAAPGGSLGGLIGESNGPVEQAYAAATVDGAGPEVGGFIGELEGPLPTAAYWDINASGQLDSPAAVGLSTVEMTGSEAPTNMTELDFESIWATKDDPAGYPRFIDQPLDLETGAISGGVFFSDNLLVEPVTNPVTLEITATGDDEVTQRIGVDASADTIPVDYIIPEVPPGSYELRADVVAVDGDPDRADDVTVTPEDGDGSGSYTVTVTAESTTEGIDFSLEKASGDSSVAEYADSETGRVETDGLREAIGDWRRDDIETGLLRDVIEAWRSGAVVG